MSDENEDINADFEFQNTQREIEMLRRKEEELMTKMEFLANKRKSASDNSLEGESGEDEASHEEIGRRRRPSLSRGSSPTKSQEKPKKRPSSITLTSESGTFRSRGSRSSSSSPRKEVKTGSTPGSRSSSTSPVKDRVTVTRRGSNTNSSTNSSRAASGSPIKRNAGSPENQSYRISITSPRKQKTDRAGSPTKITYNLKSSTSKGSSQMNMQEKATNSRSKMNRSFSTPEQSNKKLRDKSPRKRVPISKDDSDSVSVTKRGSCDERPLKEQLSEQTGHKHQGKETKAGSMGNISSVDIPENELIKRGPRADRSSSEDDKRSGAIHINDDSYEIIEIEDERTQHGCDEKVHVIMSPRRGKDNLTARQRIELELAEQQKREEELRKLHDGQKGVIVVDDKYDNDRDTGDDSQQQQGEEERTDDDDDDVDDDDDGVDDEDDENPNANVKARKIMEQEIAEQKMREEELKQIHAMQSPLPKAAGDADPKPGEEEDTEAASSDKDDVDDDDVRDEDIDDAEPIDHGLATKEKMKEEVEKDLRRGYGAQSDRDSDDENGTENDLDDNQEEEDVFETRIEKTTTSVQALTAKQKIELELAEQQLREAEFRTHHNKGSTKEDEEKQNDHTSKKMTAIAMEETTEDAFGHAPEVRQDSKGMSQLSTWEKIALEIEEEKKREEDARKQNADKKYDIDDYVGKEEVIMQEPEESQNVPASYEIDELIDFGDEIADPIDIEREDSIEDNEGYPTGRNSIKARIEKEINEEEQREKEFKYAHDGIAENESESEDEGIENAEDLNKDTKTRFNIQKEIDEFKQKELELRRLHGLETAENGFSSEEDAEEQNSKGTLSLIEQEIAEQQQRELEYRNTVRTRSDVDIMETEKGDDERNEREDRPIVSLENESKPREKIVSSPLAPERHQDRSMEEYGVKQGIARKFIHLFNEGGEELNRRHKEYDQELKSKNERHFSKEDKKSKKGRRNDSYIVEDHREDEDNEEQQVTRADYESEGDGSNAQQETVEDQTTAAQETPQHGKKLVLKRKKSKKKDEETNRSIDDSSISSQRSTIVDERRKSFERTKQESKPSKKAHPLAMHWEKIQEQQQIEARKNDVEIRKKKQEAERRKKKVFEEKEAEEKAKHQLEIKELQDRRRSLAEAWENTKNNNREVSNTAKTDMTTKDNTKIVKKSPRKSKKKETDTVHKSKEEIPALARDNIKMWEQMIASNSNK